MNTLPPQIEHWRRLTERIARPIQLMEVCGTHTVAIYRSGLRSLLPANLRLVSGPGCPVCVTAQRDIDAAIQASTIPRAIVATYGDMVRVPGALGSLEQRRAAGADVRVVASTRGALRLAESYPDREVIFIGVGFETTAPATAAAILEAGRLGLKNFSVITAHKLVVPAMRALLDGGDVRLDGFLCPGHVSVIIGAEAYRPIVDEYHMSCVVAGFEADGIATAVTALLQQIVERRPRLENNYPAVVSPEGNRVAQRLMAEVFEESDVPWRALGIIPGSGLALRSRYHSFDAQRRFGIVAAADHDHPACRCGEVIQGKVVPQDCNLFATVCTPMNPFGPCMVSSEGTCSAAFKYGREKPLPALAAAVRTP